MRKYRFNKEVLLSVVYISEKRNFGLFNILFFSCEEKRTLRAWLLVPFYPLSHESAEISKCQSGKVQIRSKNHISPGQTKSERIPNMV